VDGVGGHAAGELAAQTAVEAIRESVKDSLPAELRIRYAIVAANNRIFALAQKHPEFEGMACVLTLALVENGRVTIGHVGDSRLYLIRNGDIRKLTSDHSPAGESEDSGDLTEEEAMRHPQRNEVFRDVGSQARTVHDQDFIEIRHSRFRSNAAILLCSDGLTDQLTSAQIRGIVAEYSGDAVQVARDLVQAANQAGGIDNITALFVAGPEFRGGDCSARIRIPARLFTGRMAFLIYGLLLGMIWWAALRSGG